MILCVYTHTYKHPTGPVCLDNHHYYAYPPWTGAISSWEGEMDSATFCQGPELLFFTWATKYVASHVLTIIFFAFLSCSYRCITPKCHSSTYTPDLIGLTSSQGQHFNIFFHSPVLFPSSWIIPSSHQFAVIFHLWKKCLFWFLFFFFF